MFVIVLVWLVGWTVGWLVGFCLHAGNHFLSACLLFSHKLKINIGVCIRHQKRSLKSTLVAFCPRYVNPSEKNNLEFGRKYEMFAVFHKLAGKTLIFCLHPFCGWIS